jgi:hypothetical protein
MLFIWLIVFGFSGVACNFFTRRTEPVVSPTVVITQTVPEPVETTPPSGSLKDRIEAAVDEYKSSGVFKVTINETELTELVADQLSSQSDPMLTNPKVTLRDGHITITGVVSQSGLSLDSEIVMAPYVDMDGLPAVEIVSMTVGPFSVPEDIQAQVNTTVNDILITNLIGDENVRLDSIVVADGQMTVSGHRR